MTRNILDDPRPGLFKARFVRKGPMMPVRLVADPETGKILAQIADDPPQDDPRFVDRIWTYGSEVDEEVWSLLRDQVVWDRQHAPHSPLANPYRPVDLDTLPPGGI